MICANSSKKKMCHVCLTTFYDSIQSLDQLTHYSCEKLVQPNSKIHLTVKRQIPSFIRQLYERVIICGSEVWIRPK